MGLKLKEPIAIARGILNDRDTDGYTWTDADLFVYACGAVRAMAKAKSMYLRKIEAFPCLAGALQTLSFSTAHALYDVVRVTGGNVITQADKQTLDQFDPAWMDGTEGPTRQWFPHGDDPLKFWVWPPAPAAQSIDVEYIFVPVYANSNIDTGLPATLVDAFADYIVGMAEARNDESVLAQRSVQFITQYGARLGVKE